MKILVTGNMGYVGPSVITQLRTSYPKAILIGFDMGYFQSCHTGGGTLPENLVDIQHHGDVRYLTAKIIQDIDAVVHLAAISNDPMGNAYEALTNEINYKASVELAKKAKKAGVKTFIFASSCSVYGFAEGAARNENSELNPLTAYARSKINAEKDIKGLANKHFLVTSLRFPTACGMTERLRLDLVLNDFVAAAFSAKKIQILSDGTPWRPLIDTKDMARAIDWAVSRESEEGGAFLAVNVGRNEWNYQIKEIAQLVGEVIPNVDIEINKDAQPDKRSYQVDFSLYRQLASRHLPRVDLKQSIRDIKDGLDMIKFNIRNFRESNYIRLKVLTDLQQQGRLNNQLEWIK